MSPKQLAQKGLMEIENAIIQYMRENPQGVSNADIAHSLGLESDINGAQRNYLSWSILGNLVNRQIIKKVGAGRSSRYVLSELG
jgi:hypothetical protein